MVIKNKNRGGRGGGGLLSLILKSIIKSLMPKAPVSDFCIVTAADVVLDG